MPRVNHMSMTPAKDRDPSINPCVHNHIRGVDIGTTFASRYECARAGVHAPTVHGIHGRKDEGAFSVVVSGGYDDKDDGDVIYYTGAGGRVVNSAGFAESDNNAHREDQTWSHKDNHALMTSYSNGKPLRVIRGAAAKSKYSPKTGYRYDGLYQVQDVWEEKSNRGFSVCKVKLVRCPGQPPLPGRSASSPVPQDRRIKHESDERVAPNTMRMHQPHAGPSNYDLATRHQPTSLAMKAVYRAYREQRRKLPSFKKKSHADNASMIMPPSLPNPLGPHPTIKNEPQEGHLPLNSEPPIAVFGTSGEMQAECLPPEALDTGMQVDWAGNWRSNERN